MAPAQEKHPHRLAVLELLRAIPRDLRAAKSLAIAQRLLTYPGLMDAGNGRILTFAALPSEPDLSSLTRLLPDLDFCLPRVAGPETLAIHEVVDFAQLVRSEKGIAEPDPERHREIALDEVALILVPGLAFSSRTGHRLGRGGGYYDRFLSRPELASARSLAICFDEQAVPEVPFEAHDARVHAILTDRRLIEFS